MIAPGLVPGAVTAVQAEVKRSGEAMKKVKLTPAQFRALRSPLPEGQDWWTFDSMPAGTCVALINKGFLERVGPGGVPFYGPPPARGVRITQAGREAVVAHMGGPTVPCKDATNYHQSGVGFRVAICSLTAGHITRGERHMDGERHIFWS
jgi:hypothetical protein